MKGLLAGLILGQSFGLAAVQGDSSVAALNELRKLPPPGAYAPKDENNPGIPVLILIAGGAKISFAGSKTVVPFGDVLNALAELPKNAWIQGRMILFYDYPPGLSSSSDHASESAIKEMEEDLRRAGIELIPGASA